MIKLLTAAKKAEQNLWAIGDALLAECGPPPSKRNRYTLLREVAEYLLSEGGYRYDLKTLSELHSVAYAFPPAQRRRDVSWKVHKAARTPEFLDAIIAGTPKETPITARYVEGLRRTWKRIEGRDADEG
jgi:hypothetical protein